MFVLVRACEGLLLAHILLAASYVLGSTILAWPRGEPTGIRGSGAMLRVVSVTAAGFAAFGFLLFALGIVHMLAPLPIVAAYCGLIALFAAINRESLLRAAFWNARISPLSNAWDAGLLITYYGMLLLAIPAVIGNVGGSDPVGYHLVYPREWANAGSITIDPFLRLPFYASNFLLIYAAFMVFHGDTFVNYAPWAVMALAAMGMYSSVATVLEERFSPYITSAAGVLLTASAVLAASNLRWIPTAYIDAPIGGFALFALLSMCLAAQTRDRRWLFAAALSAGFLIGMKGSFILLLPIYAGALFLSASSATAQRKYAAVAVVTFILLASPWYVRNLILAGDPIPPVINIALHGHDGLMTKGEWALNQADLHTDKSASAAISLPFQAFWHPVLLREYGSTALILWLYACAAALILLFAFVRHVDRRLWISAILAFGSYAYWLATSSWLRYDTIFYFLLPTLVALTLIQLLPSARTSSIIAIAVAALSCIPSPGSRSYYVQMYYRNFKYLPASYTTDSDLARYSDGYADAQLASALYKDNDLGGPVFMVGIRVGYYFYENGIPAVGDWMGPAGWLRFYRAIDAGEATDFVKMLGARAVLVDKTKVLGGLDVPLERQMISGGFCKIALSSPGDVYYIAPPRGHACTQLVKRQMTTALK